MSTKDMRFSGKCVICQQTLPGSDDALMVYECLMECDPGEYGCTLCGEEVSDEEAAQIIAAGPPKINRK